MTDHSFDVYPFLSRDGFSCNLWHLKSFTPRPRGPVLLVHGAGVRSNIFNPPNRENLLHALSEAGYDVWLENWRGSTECRTNNWDLDLAAINDHPAAVAEVCRLTGARTIKAIIHCQGSTSFMISAIRGLVPQVTTIISNAVSLHPIVSNFSAFKLDIILPIAAQLSSHLNPQWADHAPDFAARLFSRLVKLTHWEKDTDVGKFVSFTYGTGFPALWELDNLSDETRNWIRGEFGFVPFSFFDHIKKCIGAGTLVSADGKQNYAIGLPQTNARIAFFAGELNKCFKAESQKMSYRHFNRLRPHYHKLHVYPGYSHLDIFFGKNAHRDVFPAMIRELNG